MFSSRSVARTWNSKSLDSLWLIMHDNYLPLLLLHLVPIAVTFHLLNVLAYELLCLKTFSWIVTCEHVVDDMLLYGVSFLAFSFFLLTITIQDCDY